MQEKLENIYSIYFSHVFFPFLITGKIADPKSPSGGSYAFSKPKPQSVEISNSSFVLQFASRRFLDQLLGMSIMIFLVTQFIFFSKYISIHRISLRVNSRLRHDSSFFNKFKAKFLLKTELSPLHLPQGPSINYVVSKLAIFNPPPPPPPCHLFLKVRSMQ